LSKSIITGSYWDFFAEELVNKLAIKKGAKVLDVGTGWGSCLIAAAKRVGSTGHLVGIDLTNDQLAEASRNIKKAAISNFSLDRMNVKDLTYKDNSFDYVLCGFIGFDDVYDFINDKYRSSNEKMKQIFRVMKQGAKVGFTSWCLQEDIKVAIDVLKDYLIQEGIKSSDEVRTLSESYSKESAAGFHQMMVDSGFKNIDVHTEDYTIIYNDFKDWWQKMMNVAWVIYYTIGEKSNLPNSLIDDFKTKMFPEGIAKNKHDNGYHFTKSVIFGLGEK